MHQGREEQRTGPRRQGRPPMERSGERVHVDEQGLLIIDQFMVGNPQFYEAARKASGAGDRTLLQSVVADFGGTLLPAAAGEYRVLRNPLQSLMLVLPLGAPELSQENQDVEPITEDEIAAATIAKYRSTAKLCGKVLVDTRCLVLCPFSLILSETPEHFRELRLRRAEKSGRDLLRGNGAAVRYGFSNRGDELGLYQLSERLYGLWPDVIDS